jgi:hypothetical protein
MHRPREFGHASGAGRCFGVGQPRCTVRIDAALPIGQTAELRNLRGSVNSKRSNGSKAGQLMPRLMTKPGSGEGAKTRKPVLALILAWLAIVPAAADASCAATFTSPNNSYGR